MECKATNKLVNYLRKHNAFVAVISGTVYQCGLPDRIICHSFLPRVAFIEFKEGKYQPTELQKEVIQKINGRCPKSSFVVRFQKDAIAIETEGGRVLALCETQTFLRTLAGVMS